MLAPAFSSRSAGRAQVALARSTRCQDPSASARASCRLHACVHTSTADAGEYKSNSGELILCSVKSGRVCGLSVCEEVVVLSRQMKQRV
jgi:DNA gyrase inhibitor GyrI